MLGWLCLEFRAARRKGRDKTYEANKSVTRPLQLQHARRFKEKDILVFADRATDFNQDDIGIGKLCGIVETFYHLTGI